MRKTLGAAALALALSTTTFAGDIPTPLGPQPPPPPMTAEPASDSIMPDGEPDSLTETVLAVIESVLALF